MEAVSNIKRLVAIDKKYHEAPVFIVPKQDPQTREVRDYAKNLDPELAKGISIKLVPKEDKDGNIVDELTVRVQHLMTFDLSVANEALLFEVVKEDPMIASSKSEVNPDYHRYYIEDKEREAAATISKSKLKRKAFDIISELSLDQMENYARVLGKFMPGLSQSQVESALYEVAEEKPQLILDVDNDKDLKHKIFLRRLLDRQILHMDNGKYMNGKDLVGINEDYAIHWLKDPMNSSLITQWAKMLEGNDPATFEPRIVDIEPASGQPGSESYLAENHQTDILDENLGGTGNNPDDQGTNNNASE
jgi:hypothetical protein